MRNLLNHIVILIFTVIFISCENNQIKTTKDIIPQAEMVDVITEIEFTQALIKLKFANQDTVDQQQLFDEVYKEFDISEEKFNNSLNYYSKEPKLLEEMYAEVINNLSEKQAEIQNNN
jgi:Domain of unknown function (DUF4296)